MFQVALISPRPHAARRAILCAVTACSAFVGTSHVAHADDEPLPAPPPGIVRLAGEADVVEDRQTLAEFVRRLDSDAWADRRDAEDELAMRLKTSASLRAAAEQALAGESSIDLPPGPGDTIRMLLDDIAADGLAEARSLHFDCHEAAAADVVREINLQAGTELKLSSSLYSAEFTGAFGSTGGGAFWPALLDFAAEHDLDIDVSSGNAASAQMLLGDAPRRAAELRLGGPHVLSGPAAVFARATSVEHERHLSRTRKTSDSGSASDRFDDTFTYTFEAFFEPRFWVGPRDFRVEWTRAVDDRGNVLLDLGEAGGVDLIDDAARRQRGGDKVGERMTTARWTAGRLPVRASLNYPEQPGTSLSIAGRILGLVGGDPRELSYKLRDDAGSSEDAANADDANVQAFRWTIAGEPTRWTITPLPAKAGKRRWEVCAQALRSLELQPDLSSLVSTAMSRARMVDADGRALRQSPARVSNDKDGVSVILIFTSDADQPLPRLVCHAPSTAVQLDVPFAFDSLPMP